MSIPKFNTYQEFEEFVKKNKKRQKLHPLTEDKLKSLLLEIYPDSHPVSEVGGILGGRNDLMQFLYSGRKVVFELFFSPSQVPQDLRLLEQSTADVKIAILLDRSINPNLADEYFRKKPDAFPHLWLSDVLLPKRQAYCIARLRELIDEAAVVDKLRLLLASPIGDQLEKHLGEYLSKIEEKVNTGEQVRAEEPLSRQQVLALLILAEVMKLGIPVRRLRSLFVWLHSQDVIVHAVRLVELGFQTFLITSLDGQHAIWTDGDVADYLFMGAEDRNHADAVVCINKTVNEFFEFLGLEKTPIRWHLFHTYDEYISEIHYIWEYPLEEARKRYKEKHGTELEISWDDKMIDLQSKQ